MMKNDATSPDSMENEVSVLIEALANNLHRLEELTAGEVDTVADREGRTFLLHRAQERLRHSEAAKQAAILNALPAHIALLDTQGVIISVNEAWRRFANANVFHAPGHGLGLNYLEVCDRAHGNHSAEAKQVAAGIRAILSGEEKRFSIEYPCHSPTEQRWFQLILTSLVDEQKSGIVVMHLNITDRKRSEAALSASESQYHSLFSKMLEGYAYCETVFEQDRLLDFVYRDTNGAFETLTGLKNVIGQKVSEVIPGIQEADPELFEIYGRVALTGRSEKYETYVAALDNWFSITAYSHDRAHFVAIFDNVTEQKKAQEALQSNQKRMRDIFDGLGPSMFVALLTPQGVLIEINQSPLTAAALQPEDVLGKPFLDAPWWIDSPDAQQKLRTAITRAAHGEPSRHDVKARGMGSELIDLDLSLQALRNEDGKIVFLILSASVITERKQMEMALRESNDKFHQLASNITDAFWIRSPDMREVQYVSPAFERIWGRSVASLYANPQQWSELIFPADRERVLAAFAALTREARNLDIEYRIVRPNGDVRWVRVRGFQVRDAADRVIRHAGIVTDVTESKDAEERMQHMAHHDALTGLPNRTLFFDTLKKTLLQAADSGWLVALLCIDLDHFKNINDTLGHATGDELLCQVSDRLMQCVRVRDTVGRLGGDEFAVILVMQDDQQGAWLAAKKIRDVLRAPFDLQGHQVAITASVGITIHPDDASDPATLLKFADTAMYRAKHAGRDTFRFFTAQMNIDVLARLELEQALRRAIDNEEFILHYQPKVQVHSGRIVGLEALLRWQRPGHGLVPPGDFIPLLEETGLIVRVGSWVIAAACRQIGLWLRSAIGPVQISVNVSGRQFIEGDLQNDIVKALADNDVTADLLELELTESSLMANTERTIECLQNLKKLGVQISIDDFGTGYSSLAYLRRFPIDKLKIDIAFIRDITTNPDDAAIALGIIGMAHSLKLEVVAEGVETAAQLAYLRRHRCDQIQGYYFSRPLPVSELEPTLLDDKCLPPADNGARVPLKTLLLVDDEANSLAALQRLFRQDGYRILSASSAEEGFKLLALHPVQVIVCDQRMPVMSGTVFLDRVKNLYPDTFRIVLSGYTDVESILEAINRGSIYRFYTKPWDNKELRDNIREAFRHYWLLHDMHASAHDSEVAEDATDMQPPAELT